MLPHRKLTREFLTKQDRETFLDIVYKAKLSPKQKEILFMDLLDDQDHYFIGDTVGLTKGTIDHKTGPIYDLIYSYLTKHKLIMTV